MTSIQPEHFEEQVYEASKAAFSKLITANTNQRFYAFALFTDDSLQFLYPVANTEEALQATVQHYREKVDPKHGCTSTRAGMRWAYGDWGFFPDVGGDHFNEINEALSSNFDRMVADEEFENFFGTGPARSKITLLVVGDLPKERVNAWVSALNPPDVVDQFINWNCDAPDDDAE
jgi:hypothetical protein